VDPAVGLVQAYLQLNGYFTVVEYPVVVPTTQGTEVLTDVDLIALRFPLALPLGIGSGEAWQPDPLLRATPGGMDLLICEVKEGKARLNPNLMRDEVLAATLRRVGCCPEAHITHHVRDLLRHGETMMTHEGVSCRARLAVFAGRKGQPNRAGLAIGLPKVARFLADYLQRNEARLHSTHLTQPALAYLQLMEKLRLLRTAD